MTVDQISTTTITGQKQDRLARVVTEAGAPWVINVAASFGIGVLAHAPWWGLFVAAITGLGPMAMILAGIRAKRLGDHHVTDSKQRPAAVLAILGVVLGGLALEIVVHAPRLIIALTATAAAMLTVCTVITIAARWKISVHTAVSAGMTVVFAIAMSPWWLVALVATPMIGWSRVQLGDHTRAQTLAGAFAGAVIAAIVFWATR